MDRTARLSRARDGFRAASVVARTTIPTSPGRDAATWTRVLALALLVVPGVLLCGWAFGAFPAGALLLEASARVLQGIGRDRLSSPAGAGSSLLSVGLLVCGLRAGNGGGREKAGLPGPSGPGACDRQSPRGQAANPEPGQTAPPRSPARSDPSPRRGHLLVVDDDQAATELMAELLRFDGFDVSVAHSVAAAMAAPLDRIDCVITDLDLPDGTGADLLRLLRTVVDVPVVALSGFDSRTFPPGDAPFAARLVKPIDYPTLEAAIRSALAASCPPRRAESPSGPRPG
ncbi:response regulator [Tautonia sociabilis]|uniref:Response regulator n=1 Tax=Tautonia sociabilis TaxID=2080755 RepID=A0A432MNP3_9BACT|nr:response regulator [Tautonia sociabilis]RUL88715.1 response regulator [Tautonia sociabilis]